MGVDNYGNWVTATALQQFQQAPQYDTLSEMFSEHAGRGGTLFSPDNDLRDKDDHHMVTQIVMRTNIDVLDSFITNDGSALMAIGYPLGFRGQM